MGHDLKVEDTMEIPFTKMQGNDEFEKAVIPDEMKGQFAALYCDRRFGIGADGVIYLLKSAKNSAKMRLFQPDESEAEMCGNGIRCLAKYAFDQKYVKESCTVETLAGDMAVTMGYREDEFFATTTMPAPKFGRSDIPATGEGDYKEKIGDYDVYAVNTGVPHAVIFVDAVESVDIAAIAPAIRHHASFPQGANVNFVQRGTGDSITIRTFERGVEAETPSCGTGATAAAAMAHKLGFVGTTVHVETNGGPLTISLADGVKMEGPAATVFFGAILF
jgi:diaminopimelate epimerase